MNFKENALRGNFRKKDIPALKKLIDSSISFSVCGMPGMGISIFLRFLATQNFAHFIHIDINGLTELTKKSFVKTLNTELKGLNTLLKKHRRIVIIFNRFGKLAHLFDYAFFANLRSIRDKDKEKIIMVFAVNKPLVEQAQKGLSGGNLNMYSQTYYLKPYQLQDLKRLIALNSPKLMGKNPTKALKLCGGHYQLLQLLLKSDFLLGDPLNDAAIYLQLKELYQSLTYKQQKQIQKVALNKKISSVDTYLLDNGYIDKKEKLAVFSDLFSEFIRSHKKARLPVKEMQLYKILKSHIGQVVTKDEIFETIWKNEAGSDWALNALIYRLRKNPFFVSKSLRIENYKKVGYVMFKN